MTVTVNGASAINGVMQVPPSKSMAHRMLICAALARGISKVENLDYSVDINTTLAALQQLGAKITCDGSTAVVEGLPGGFATVTRPVNCHESGSSLRFLIPLFSLTSQQVRFVGAPRLLQRPLNAYEDIFAGQGLSFEVTPEALTIKGALRPGLFELPGNVSSQFISGLLFVLPLLEKDSTIHLTTPLESAAYIELTRQAQAIFGIQSEWQDAATLLVPGNQVYQASEVQVEGDWSQAAVPAVLAAVRGGVAINGLLSQSAQGDTVLANIIAAFGAKVEWGGKQLRITPPQAGLQAPKAPISLAECPDLGPLLFTLAAFAQGTTQFTDAGRLRIKESDRIAAMQQELGKLGVVLQATDTTLAIQGAGALQSGETVDSHNDHRIAMALATAALCGKVQLTITGADAVSKSWPSFFEDLTKLGAEVG